jgi:ABC-type glycerol-3-phosphate transport system substrate-binding protein
MKGLGNPVVGAGLTGYASMIQNTSSNKSSSAASVVRYFAQFSDPVKPVYSWNRSQPTSRNAFLAGTLALYFAPASELLSLRNANPNLNFDVSEMPMVRGGQVGGASSLLSLSIPNGSKNPGGALAVAGVFISAPVQKIIASTLHLPSVRRDTNVSSASDAYQSVFRDASLTAFSFLDPDPSASDAVFKRMIEGVLSGKFREEEATQAADQELSALLGVRSQ